MECHGNSEDHCCHLGGEVCEHLEHHTVAGRRWACGLLRKSESWAHVYALPEYRDVRSKLTAIAIEQDCGDWPPPGLRCGTCGGVD